MAEIKGYPNNKDEEVGAETLMKWLHGRTSGVFAADGTAAVSAAQNKMAVNVSDGYGWLTDAEKNGIVWWIENQKATGAPLEIGVDPADGVLARIDRVIVEWTVTNYTAEPVVKILKGSISSNPSAPALTNNSTTRQISLARIRIPAGTTMMSNSLITDERTDASVCGIVTDRVEVDTSMINANVNATLTEIQKQANDTLTDVQSQSAATLKSINDLLAELEAGTAVELRKLKFEDVQVAVSDFEADESYQDYPYRASAVLTGVLASMTPEVTLSVEDATSGNFAPVSEAYNGGVYLYAAQPPEDTITIPTIICWR